MLDITIQDVVVFVIICVPLVFSLGLLAIAEKDYLDFWVINGPWKAQTERETKEKIQSILANICESLLLFLLTCVLSVMLNGCPVLALLAIWFGFLTLMLIDSTEGRNATFISKKYRKRIKLITLLSSLLSFALFSSSLILNL